MSGVAREDLEVGMLVYVPLDFGDNYNKCKLISRHCSHIHRENGTWVWLVQMFRGSAQEEYHFTVVTEDNIEVESINYDKVAKKLELQNKIDSLNKELRELN